MVLDRRGRPPGEAGVERNAPPFSEEVDTGQIHDTYGWDGYINEPDMARVGISCSGGGIRSASYCLGVLQVLRTSGYLGSADYLAAVSGGDYISAAHTLLVSETLKAAVDAGQDPSEAEKRYFGGLPPWALSSPEEEHLRDRSSYLAPGLAGKAWFGLNLLYGLIRHLLPFAAIIFLTSAGFAVAFGTALGSALTATTPPFPGVPHGILTPMYVVLAGLALVAGVGLLIRQVEQAREHPNPDRLNHLQSLVMTILWLQVSVALLGLGLPALLVWLHHRPLRLLTNAGAAAGFEGGSLSITSLFAYLARRGTSGGRGKTIKYLMPVLTTLLGPLIVGIPFVGLTYWMAQRLHHFLWLPAILAAASAALLLVFTFLDESTPNMHLLYRERLATAFVGRRRIRRERDRSYLVFDEPPWSRAVRLSEICGGKGPAKLPKLVVCAAVNVSQDVPPGRLAASFTFERDYSGGPLTGYLPTKDLEDLAGRSILTLPGMIAISGAALSPSMGKMTRPWLRLLLAIFNARLGVWLPNPLCHDPLRPRQLRPRPESRDRMAIAEKKRPFARTRRRFRSPGTLYALREALGLNDVHKRFVYVTDGGHWDNLGLVELLRRGCGQILCFDAAGDDLEHFPTLSQAIALARSELGVRIEIDFTDLIPGDKRLSPSDHVRGCIRYPNGTVGVLVFAKLAMPQGAPKDALAYRDRDPKFPTNPVSDQLFNDQKFESFHALGRHAAMGVVRTMNAWRRAQTNDPEDKEPPAPCSAIEPEVKNPYPTEKGEGC